MNSESGCCSFLSFRVTVEAERRFRLGLKAFQVDVTLALRAPAEAPLIQMFPRHGPICDALLLEDQTSRIQRLGLVPAR